MEADRLEQNFGKLHALHAAAFVRHLVECRRACDGDLDLFLVLSIIGERTFNPRSVPRSMTHDEFLEGTVDSIQPVAINLQSIADYSGIPRETVRRKIEQLIARGWVRRDAMRFVTATDQANEELRELTASLLRYLRQVEAALASCTSD